MVIFNPPQSLKLITLLAAFNLPTNPETAMRFADHARRLARVCRIPIRRPASARSVDHILADIRRMLMEPSADAQAIINQLNALPAAITAQVASEVSTAEAAKDAQRAADIAAIGAAVTAVSAGVTPAA